MRSMISRARARALGGTLAATRFSPAVPRIGRGAAPMVVGARAGA